METCDVLIVGGGPAGSTCAWKLRQRGLDVTVMDKAAFPRDKVCAGWITPAVVDLLQLDVAAYAQECVIQPITGFLTGQIDGGALETRYPATVSYGIRRREFDDYLLRRSGARLRLGEPLHSLERQGERWLVNGAIAAPLVIGAGGHFCPVAQHLGASLGAAENAVVAKETEFEMDAGQLGECRVRPEVPELYFCRDLKGYGWCFRKGNYLNVGLGRADRRGLSEHLAGFCEFLRQRGRIPRDIPDKFHGHAYLLYGDSGRRIQDDGILLIGDAAGLAAPQSGEGIRPAVESGALAAAAILEAAGDYRGQRLAAYAERLRARFGAPAPTAGGFVPEAVRVLLGAALLKSRWLTRRVVLDSWFLDRRRPAYAG